MNFAGENDYSPERKYLHLLYNHGRHGKHGRIVFHFLYSVFSVLSVVKLSFEIGEGIWVFDYSSVIGVPFIVIPLYFVSHPNTLFVHPCALYVISHRLRNW